MKLLLHASADPARKLCSIACVKADTSPQRVHDTWCKTGRCQLCRLPLGNILQQMAKLNDQDPENVLKSAHFNISSHCVCLLVVM